jgi:hypothetical protein
MSITSRCVGFDAAAAADLALDGDLATETAAIGGGVGRTRWSL